MISTLSSTHRAQTIGEISVIDSWSEKLPTQKLWCCQSQYLWNWTGLSFCIVVSATILLRDRIRNYDTCSDKVNGKANQQLPNIMYFQIREKWGSWKASQRKMQRKRKSAKKNLLRTGRKPSALVITPFHTPLCELSDLPITTSFQLCQFWVPASSCLWCWSIRPLDRRPSPWTRRCEALWYRSSWLWGDVIVLSKESPLVLSLKCNVLPLK